jgi:hypothetical protein
MAGRTVSEGAGARRVKSILFPPYRAGTLLGDDPFRDIMAAHRSSVTAILET